jgi:hypothetical protein
MSELRVFPNGPEVVQAPPVSEPKCTVCHLPYHGLNVNHGGPHGHADHTPDIWCHGFLPVPEGLVCEWCAACQVHGNPDGYSDPTPTPPPKESRP